MIRFLLGIVLGAILLPVAVLAWLHFGRVRWPSPTRRVPMNQPAHRGCAECAHPP